ncbi:hypothetical protein Q5741_04175 [Paenibacillus sp. JX-17]|uniref:DUF1902 domain-containing protein n=1 Tax=Paenibacillus lacisoli TaxID=3064525 RepID=A0ABT9CCA4_9BACL|nr:hypothetical protein [Paenibacillus sp. JX-17]MDO7905607.1 hypothetical protein [Paenibacillus sp. JX-17]
MIRYLFEYEVKSTGYKGEFSWVAENEEQARTAIRERVADLEFVDLEDVIVGQLLKTLDATQQYYECEGCSS